MHYKIAIFLFSFFLISCEGNDEVKIPPDILPKEKMAEVFVDIHLMEAAMNLNLGSIDKASVGTPNEIPPIDVFKKNGITKQQFDESYTFYSRYPEVLTEVFQIVLDDLSKMQAEAMKKK
jgi:hypothetical protein